MSHSPTPHRSWRGTAFRAPRRPAAPGYVASRRGPRRRLPRGIGLTLALFVSLGLWALLGFAFSRLLDLL